MTDDATAAPSGLLDGVVVLDLTRVLAGPISGYYAQQNAGKENVSDLVALSGALVARPPRG